jgi:hypothetical protein
VQCWWWSLLNKIDLHDFILFWAKTKWLKLKEVNEVYRGESPIMLVHLRPSMLTFNERDQIDWRKYKDQNVTKINYGIKIKWIS